MIVHLLVCMPSLLTIVAYLFSGWHRRLNGRAGAAPPFYLLVRLLADEAQVSVRNVRLVTELQLTRYQRQQYRGMQAEIFQLWKRYRRGEVSATGLLKQLSTKYKPAVDREWDDRQTILNKKHMWLYMYVHWLFCFDSLLFKWLLKYSSDINNCFYFDCAIYTSRSVYIRRHVTRFVPFSRSVNISQLTS